MKILHLMFSKVNGGLEQVFLNYIPALGGQGNHVISVVHPQAEIISSCPKEHLITLHNYNKWDFIAILRLRKLIKKEQPDCIITHSYRAAYLAKRTLTKVPKIAVCHVRGHYDFGSDAIIAITEQMRQDIINSGKPAETVFTVPNMVHIPEYLTYKEPKSPKIPVIGACARFAPIKGIDVLIEALGELKKRGIPFQAKIAGDGKEKEHYVEQIKRLSLEQEVTLLGWIENRHAFYEELDIFCLPSREEAFGLVVLESMMHSLPMVLSRLSGPLEIVSDSGCALFAEPEDPLSLANGLQQLIQNNPLAKELGARAFLRVAHYAIPNVGPILQQALERVCQDFKT